MLLDLNVGIISGEPGREETRSVMEAEDCPTSSSSVVSAEDARNNAADGTFSSANSSSPLVFDVFKKDPSAHLVNGRNPAPEFVTRELFPVAGDGQSSAKSSTTQWLNLSFVDKNGPAEVGVVQAKPQVRKSRRGPRSRSSQYRGVTFYRRTGRWESHIWDCGKQVYLGGFDTAHSAARAYDRAAIKFRGVDADINFTLSDYDEDMKQTQNLSKEEFVHVLRRHTTGLAKGGSKYRASTLHKAGPWVARAGQFIGKRDGAAHFDHEGEIVVHTNLDLSLGMSLTSNGQKGDVKDLRFQYVAREIPTREGKMINNTALAPGFGGSLNGLPVASKHARPNLYPGFFQTYEGRVKMEAGTSPRHSGWAWQAMHNNGGASNAVPVYSSAASSGFASSGTSTIVSSAVPVHQQNNVVRSIYQHQHPMFMTAASSPRQSQS